MIRCTFAGHRDVTGLEETDVEAALEKIIDRSDSPIECLAGGMGNFDHICASAVRRLKRKYQNKEITLILVLPYMQKRINRDKAYYENRFDLILIPSQLEGVHYKQAIGLRNRWMVEQSDYLIAMVNKEYGGAYTTLKYAKKLGKTVINLAERGQ